MPARFSHGQTVATSGALDALGESGQSAMEFLSRHIAGDWGEVDPEDQQANEDALLYGERLLSAYPKPLLVDHLNCFTFELSSGVPNMFIDAMNFTMLSIFDSRCTNNMMASRTGIWRETDELGRFTSSITPSGRCQWG